MSKRSLFRRKHFPVLQCRVPCFLHRGCGSLQPSGAIHGAGAPSRRPAGAGSVADHLALGATTWRKVFHLTCRRPTGNRAIMYIYLVRLVLLGRLQFLFYERATPPASWRDRWKSLREEIDARFSVWLNSRYQGLHNQPALNPVMVQHVARFLHNDIRGGGEPEGRIGGSGWHVVESVGGPARRIANSPAWLAHS